ncbi:glucanosyltransferase domain-containing protein [Sarocladium implicatum]|nr:glucanosyltransferase domain-containing protein [Sarocladium implicatum]
MILEMMGWASTRLVRFLGFAALAAHCVEALAPITIKGTKLYDEDGQQFFVKGVVYSPFDLANDEQDPLKDPKRCQLDAGMIKDLGANTIRVYIVDETADHDGCMEAFANAGIYVWLDLPKRTLHINRFKPEWTQKMYDSWTQTIDNFAQYDNVLFYTISNESVDSDHDDGAPYVKAAVRDIKAFVSAREYRRVPVIYASADDMEARLPLAEYLACGKEEETIDAYGLNVYSWCGDSSYYESGYDKLYEQFESLDIPVLFSETGCNAEEGDRKFPDVKAMLGNVFQAVFSGVVVFEYAQHENDYGIVEYPSASSSGTNLGFPVTLAEYNSLSKMFSSMNPTGTSANRYTPTNSAPECPETLFGWAARTSLPTIKGLDVKTIAQSGTYSESPSTGTNSGDAAGVSTSPPTTTPKDTKQKDGTDAGNEDDGLSTGAVGGIAAGVAVVVLGGIAAAVFFILRRRKTRKSEMQETPEKIHEVPSSGKTPGAVYEVASPPAELGSGPRFMSQELEASNRGYSALPQHGPAELDGYVHEMPAEKFER